MDINQIRNDTTGCDSVIHLNNAGAALMPKPVINAIHNYIQKKKLRVAMKQLMKKQPN